MCSFELQFDNAKLLGRKGRCPQCRHKFILNETETTVPSAAGVHTSAPSPTIGSETKSERVDSTAGVASSPAAAKTSAAKPRATAPQKKGGSRWKADYQRGLGSRRPTLSARWVLPDVLAVSTVAAISMGAIIGASITKSVLTTEWLKAVPAALPNETILALAAAFGGAAAACCLVRKHDPLQPDRPNDDRQDK
jgi:hypothetical protein